MTIKFLNNFHYLSVIQMLKDLPKKDNFPIGQIILNDIDTAKVYLKAAKFCSIAAYEARDYITGNISTARWT